MIWKALKWLGMATALLAAVLVFNALRARPEAHAVARAPDLAFDLDAAARRLGEAIAIPTISQPDAPTDTAAFASLHALLEQRYPRVHAALAREVVSDASLLYRWNGRDESCAPLLLTAHQDVVPIEPGTEANWTQAPFSGRIAGGDVWGRGALDDKGSLVAILEATEALLAEGFVPACPVYFAFGHDEEIGGESGAAAMAALLAGRGVKPGFVLDEGGLIAADVLPVPTATIGVAEKGYASVRLTVEGAGGHSSMPPRETAIGILANAVARVERERPPAAIGAIQREGYRRVAPHVPFGQRVVLTNLWLTAPLVEHLFAGKPSLDATLRTTTAPTILRAGVKDNVLASHAEAVVNFRIRVGDSVEGVRAHVVRVVDDARVEVAVEPWAQEPSQPSPYDGAEFAQIERALRAVSDEQPLVVMPYVTIGATDVRRYAILTDRTYRFMPVKLAAVEFDRMHGSNERLAVAEFGRAIRFYAALLRAYVAPEA